MRIKISRRTAQKIPDPSKRQVEAMNRLFRHGIQEFVTKLAFDLSQHIDTGMTISSILSVAGKVQYQKVVAAEINGFGPKKKGHQNLYGAPVPSENIGDFKSRTLGKNLGRKAYTFELANVSNPKMKFEFKIVVLQHWFNEPKWDSVNQAYEAMSTFIEANWRDYVLDIDDWLINGKIGFRR